MEYVPGHFVLYKRKDNELMVAEIAREGRLIKNDDPNKLWLITSKGYAVWIHKRQVLTVSKDKKTLAVLYKSL